VSAKNQNTFKPDMLRKAVLVSAHPDDEILWFSSIIDKVEEVVMCFLDCASKPQISIGRTTALSNYPINNITNLNIEESEVFNYHNWINPKITEFGMEIINRKNPEKKYENNYNKLKYYLRNKLKNYDNVITHNPWGEYGNEEHVQVYRVIKSLHSDFGFNIWFSNYCSNKSLSLMLKYLASLDSEYYARRTNKKLSKIIKELYQSNECWTWYEDWEWFDEEAFIRDKISSGTFEEYGRLFPLNLIKVKSTKRQKKFSFLRKLALDILLR